MNLFLKSFLIVYYFIFCVCFAQEAKDTKKYNIEALDPNLDFSHLKSQYNVIDQSNYTSNNKDKLISLSRRNKLFQEAGLEEEVKEWDQLDKDMLYIRASRRPLIYLLKKYPKIDEQLLKTLKTLLEKKQ